MAEDYGVTLKITADTSALDQIPQKVESTRKEIERPVEQTVEAKIEQPAPVKVSQDPDPLKIKVELPDPAEIEAAIPKKDFHLDVQPQLDPSKFQAIPPINIPSNPVKPKVDPSEAVKGFNLIKASMDVLHGNFAGLAMEMAKLSNGAGMLKTIGVSGFLAIGGAIMGVVQLAKSLHGLFATMFNVGTVGRDISSIGASLVDIKNQAEQFADAMNDARKASELVNQSLEKEIAALGRVAKAQNEINRQRELSGAKSDEERDAINLKYDQQAIGIDADTAQQTEELKRKGIVDEIARLEQEIEQSKKTQAAYEDKAAEARARATENTTLTPERQKSTGGTILAGAMAAADSVASMITGRPTDDDKARAASEAATNAQNAADDEAERRAQLEEELEKKRHDLKIADLEAEARKAETEAQKQANAQSAATKSSQEAEREEKENAEKDKRHQNAQASYAEERDRRAKDAEFERNMRASQRMASDPNATEDQRQAAENDQLAMLKGKEDEAAAELEQAEKELAEEMAKEAKDRDEDRMARARRRAAEAQAAQLSAQQQQEELKASIQSRRESQAKDYFGKLAQQIEDSRPKNRLTAMGLGSGDGSGGSTQREQLQVVRQIASEMRAVLDAIRENKPERMTAVYTE